MMGVIYKNGIPYGDGPAQIQSDWKENDTTSAAYIRNKPDKLPADGGNADTVGGYTPAQLMQNNPNLLINPDFKINQRGVSGTITKNDDGSRKYFVDRWYVESGSVTINSDGSITLDGNIVQKIDIEINDTCSVSSSAGRAYYRADLKMIMLSANNERIEWVKLEAGDVVTPFITPDPITELMKCQKYYIEFNPDGNKYAYLNAVAIAANANTAYAVLTHPVPMNTGADKKLIIDGNWRIIATNAIVPDSFAITNSSTLKFDSVNTTLLTVTATGKLTAGQAYSITANNDASARLAIDAEL